ncbi:hypothetical protein VK70_13195 [Paenibacillus durus ATCC 35681]|uniref:Uncharacterized protein n=1 Tax=Paenibacillus durus ATCC 35681 TaxID=1333534 RepID=A0A0F7FAV5_PAEDU|nr:hypothetical protein VK70_13195 [Paenibacillus durus ATCC 35681]
MYFNNKAPPGLHFIGAGGAFVWLHLNGTLTADAPALPQAGRFARLLPKQKLKLNILHTENLSAFPYRNEPPAVCVDYLAFIHFFTTFRLAY